MRKNGHSSRGMLDRFFKSGATRGEKKQISNWLLHLDISDESLSAEQLTKAREDMYRRITGEHAMRVHPPTRVLLLRRVSAAAAVLLLATATGLLLTQRIQKNSALATTTIRNEEGKQVKYIHLPDGTDVWLNSRSVLTFTTNAFNKADRQVQLTGEAYFEVATNSSKPFTVTSGNIHTQVLGTAFNIENYSGESEIRVSLAQGKVKMIDDVHADSTLLAPDEMYRYSRKEQRWSILPIAGQYVKDWTTGSMVFNEMPLTEVLTRIGQKYQLTFQYDAALLNAKRATGHFRPSQWQTMLSDILFIHHLSYTVRGNVVRIIKQQ